MSRVRLIHGDALTTLETLASGSFDACLTDPPYGLSFMGRRWDHGVPSSEVWREVLRCLRPGASLMAFGGTRTYHRLAVAVEDAGFEIRDSVLVPGVVWSYGSGFPKSLDVSKAIDTTGGYNPSDAARILRASRESAGLSREEVAAAVGCTPASVRDWEEGRSRAKGRAVESITPSPEYRAKLATLLGYSSDERRLVGLSADRRGDGTAFDLGHSGQLTAGGNTDAAKRWEGYGTALKPAWEPVVWAMKPVDGTFARNAIEHGVAGVNVDAGRVAANGDKLGGGAEKRDLGNHGWDRPWRKDPEAQTLHAERVRANVEKAESSGRFPSNLILAHLPGCRREGAKRVRSGNSLQSSDSTGAIYPRKQKEVGPHYADPDGTEEVVAWKCVEGCPVLAMDRASGECGSSSGYVGAPTSDEGGASWSKGMHAQFHYSDLGTASRFFQQCAWEPGEFERTLFYYAKAPTAERMVDGERLLHPTMKPLALATYLARMLLPPPREDGQPRRLLVPYSGVGSEVIGALRAGWDEVVAIELDPDGDGWIESSARRIEADAPLFNKVEIATTP